MGEGLLSTGPTYLFFSNHDSALKWEKTKSVLFSKCHLFRTTSYCPKRHIIPLKGITRSSIREDTGDAWNVIRQLRWHSVPCLTKLRPNSTSLSWYFSVSLNWKKKYWEKREKNSPATWESNTGLSSMRYVGWISKVEKVYKQILKHWRGSPLKIHN